MSWESFGLVRFDLGPLVQGQTRIAKLKSAYNCDVKPTHTKSWASFKNKMAVILHVKLDYPIKKTLYPLSLLLGVPKVKTTYTKLRPETIF